ncbi:N-acetyltransferase family protein [Sorangium sp. So ce1389]|uniref:GNAT family N-acetyltransferase n=1 Tax=Sorangium sp. So ce1389 TaxID=3133336 RepID=UPI003F5FD30B
MGSTTDERLSGFRWLWLDAIDELRRERLARMLNRVLETDDTVGFPGPIPHEEALRVVDELDRAVRARHSYLLLLEDEQRVGSQLILVPNRSPNNRHVGWVFRAMVDPEFRRLGVAARGSRLLVEKSEELGLERLCIDVRAGTPAESIWKHFGFEPFGRLPDYARVKGQSVEGIYMHQTVARLKERCHELVR